MNEQYQPIERVGYAYVPMQHFGEIYPPEQGLERGTIFPELDLPISVYGIVME